MWCLAPGSIKCKFSALLSYRWGELNRFSILRIVARFSARAHMVNDILIYGVWFGCNLSNSDYIERFIKFSNFFSLSLSLYSPSDRAENVCRLWRIDLGQVPVGSRCRQLVACILSALLHLFSAFGSAADVLFARPTSLLQSGLRQVSDLPGSVLWHALVTSCTFSSSFILRV